MRSKKLGYALATGLTAGVLALGSVAWACTPQNGVTRLVGLTNNDYARGEPVVGYAEFVTARGDALDHNWKLYIGTGGMWCMSGEPYLKTIDPQAYSYDTSGRVPALPGNATGTVPTDAPLGTNDICMNNGDGGGNTAYPISVTITRR